MTTGEAEIWLRKELRTIYEEGEAANISALVMEHITGMSKLERTQKKDEPLVVKQLHQLTSYHHRLMQHEPMQYVLEEAWFYGMKLFVDNNVLIPRPETEELVDWIVKDVKANGIDVFTKGATDADASSLLKILDVGTGSGCIALGLKKAMPKAAVWGCDLSEGALNTARKNGSELGLSVDFINLDFLDKEQWQQLPEIDILVSNPPYIPVRDKDNMHANVLQFEPHSALFVPDDNALIFYDALARFGKTKLRENGVLYVEIHEGLGKETAELFEQHGYSKVEIKRDMQGKDRMIKALR